MKEYRVIWMIDILAETPDDAALKAYMIQQDADSIATVFNVREKDNPGAIMHKVDVDVENMSVN